MAALVVLAVAGWVVGARPLSLLVDRVHTIPVISQPVTALGLENATGGMIDINGLPMNTEMPDNRPFPMKMETDAQGRFTVTIDGKLIALGAVTEGSGGPVLKPEAGDRAIFSISRSLISWPTPFKLNFMTGHAPSWKRHMYYRLTWQKPDGSKLEMLWRYEQWFYGTDGWASAS